MVCGKLKKRYHVPQSQHQQSADERHRSLERIVLSDTNSRYLIRKYTTLQAHRLWSDEKVRGYLIRGPTEQFSILQNRNLAISSPCRVSEAYAFKGRLMPGIACTYLHRVGAVQVAVKECRSSHTAKPRKYSTRP